MSPAGYILWRIAPPSTELAPTAEDVNNPFLASSATRLKSMCSQPAAATRLMVTGRFSTCFVMEELYGVWPTVVESYVSEIDMSIYELLRTYSA